MKIAQRLFDSELRYRKENSLTKIQNKIIHMLRRIIGIYCNPLVSYDFMGINMLVPFRHHWPYDSKYNPEWSMCLGRAASVVSGKYPNAVMFDIGANIGDTCAIIRGHKVANHIYAIEGVSIFFEILVKNAEKLGNIHPIKAFLSNESLNRSVHLKVLDSGNARVYLNSKLYGHDASRSTISDIETVELSKLMLDLPASSNIKFLKTDVESMDMPILNAAIQVIKEHLPVIFFECHIANAHEAEHGIKFIDFIKEMREIGYSRMMYWDCSCEYRFCFNLDDDEILHDFDAAYRNRKGKKYADVCLFHYNDIDICEKLRLAEREHFISQRSIDWTESPN